MVVVGGGVLYGVETNVAEGLCEHICLPLLGKRGLKMGYGVLHNWIKDMTHPNPPYKGRAKGQ